MTSRTHQYWLRLAAAAVLTALFVALQFLWFNEIYGSPDPVNAALRDWIQFHRTAIKIVSGRTVEMYPVDRATGAWVQLPDGYYFFYPPFVAWITLPLASLSRMAAYLACVLSVVADTLAATFGILRSLKASAVQKLFSGLATIASAPWNIAVFLGHLSAGLILSPCLALWAWSRQRPMQTGVGLALMLAKPNWGVPMGAFLVCGRQWKTVGGFAVGGFLLCLVSLPLGPELWGDWLRTMINYRTLIADATPPWKQATLFATIESVTGRSGSDPWVFLPWVACSTPLLAATALAWFRRGDRAEDFPRLLGIALLATLVANPYAYFYDALLQLPLAVILWTQPDRYRSAGIRRGALAVSLFTYLWMHLQFFVLKDAGPSITGLGLAVWLLLELADLLRPTGSEFEIRSRG